MSTQGLTCQELVELVTEYLEDALPPQERARFEAHIHGCEGCQAYVDQMQQMIKLAGQLTEDQLSGPVRQKLLDAFRNWRKAS